MKWLNETQWSEITREERQFCAELYCTIKDDPGTFVEILNSSQWPREPNKQGSLDSNANWEVGIEVAFYRDIGFSGIKLDADVGKASPHRKFDLALFSDQQFIIIEAKAQQGFEQCDLDEYMKDRTIFDQCLSELDTYFVGLCSHQYIGSKHRQLNLEGVFDILLPWCKLAEHYSNDAFTRANEVYGN